MPLKYVQNYVSFVVLKAVNISILVFRVVTPCGPADIVPTMSTVVTTQKTNIDTRLLLELSKRGFDLLLTAHLTPLYVLTVHGQLDLPSSKFSAVTTDRTNVAAGVHSWVYATNGQRTAFPTRSA